MATNYTQFISPYLAAWNDNVPESYQASWRTGMSKLVRYSVQKKGSRAALLNNGQMLTVPISGQQQTDWLTMVVRCVGAGHVNLIGKDSAGATIQSSLPVYGNNVFPGILIISTYNLTASPVIVSDQDASTFYVFNSTCVEDGT